MWLRLYFLDREQGECDRGVRRLLGQKGSCAVVPAPSPRFPGHESAGLARQGQGGVVVRTPGSQVVLADTG